MGLRHQKVIIMNENLEIMKEMTKRDIFRFDGPKPTAINIEHVNMMMLEGKKITFFFHYNNMSIDLNSEEEAKSTYEKLLNFWASE